MPSEAESFLGISPQPPNMPPDPDAIGFGRRALLLAVAWIGALLITCPDPRGIILLPLFTAGLLFFAVKTSGGESMLMFVWLFYGALCTFILFCSKRVWFYLFYALLAVLLLTNVAGCRQILREFSNIH